MPEAIVLEYVQTTTEDGAHVGEAKCDLGGEQLVTARYYSPPGYDTHPLPGDTALLVPAGGKGNWAAVGFLDPGIAPETEPGEVLFYSRSAPGTIAAKLLLKADGSIVLNDGAAVLGADGVLTVPEDVVGGGKSLKTHTHPGSSLTTTATAGLSTPGTISGNTGTPN